jgi:hypothetical protein
VTHTLGHIDIDLMWHRTKLDQSGQSCALVHDLATGELQEMLIAPQGSLQLHLVRTPEEVVVRRLRTARIAAWRKFF